MRKHIAFLALFLGISLGLAAQNEVPVTVDYVFMHVQEGYDHDSKCKLFVDGELVEESAVGPESVKNTFSAKVPAGTHTFRVENWALYEGQWEPHTIEMSYSIDCFWEEELTIKKSLKVSLVFDIESECPKKYKETQAAGTFIRMKAK